MPPVIDLTIAAASMIAIGAACLVRRLARDPHPLPVTAAWIDDLSRDRYLPMVRLLSGRDVRYLEGSCGYSRAKSRSFRRQRCRLFRAYLGSLRNDFECVMTALGVVLVDPHGDGPNLTMQLLRERVTFEVGLAVIHCRLALFEWGIGGVDTESILRSFEHLRVELRHLVPPAAAMAA